MQIKIRHLIECKLKNKDHKEERQMVNRHIKTCSASLIIREVQIKTTMRYHLTSVRMAIIKKRGANASKDVEQRESVLLVGM